MKQNIKILALFLMLAAAAFFVISCGSDTRDTAGGGATVDTSASYVGPTACFNCHYWSVGESYLQGKHVIHSDHITAQSDDTCLDCHDPLREGRSLEEYIDPADVPLEGLAAVTCEDCHGGGGNHFGSGPIPYPSPDPFRCGQCHSSAFTHNAYHPEGDNIVEHLQNSQHYSGGIHGDDANGDVNPRCSRCHTDEGARKYKYIQGDNAELTAFFDNEPLLEDGSPIQCRTCHDPHDPTTLLMANSASASAEFNTCTNCHQIGIINATSLTGDLSEPYHRDRNDDTLPRDVRTILDTHFDNALTANIEGYVLDPLSDRVCRNCHNVHLANVNPDSSHIVNAGTSVNAQWAESAHGGHISESTYVGGVANVTETEAPAFVHYDFKAMTGGFDGTGRQACQRCHTSTGFKNFAADPALYNSADNVFYASGEQREMLYCWACHSDNAGGFNNPGLINATLPYAGNDSREDLVADLEGSNLCVSCHSGRSSGNAIKAETFPLNGVHFGSFNSHYLGAAGTMFRLVGYEYDTGIANYNNVGYYAHSGIGIGNTAIVNAVGSVGPCVGCHMGSDSSHTFDIFTYNSPGIANAIANQDVCDLCHGAPYTMDLTVLEEESLGYQNALDALEQELASAGYYYSACYPYFYNSSAFLCDSGYRAVDWPNEGILGAAFNFNYLGHEPGGFAHNRYYAKWLIFDSIDWMDNGIMNSFIDLTTAPEAAAWYQGDITNTADDNNVIRPVWTN